ncbi:MAG: hypothetical protein MRY32_05405 [Rickettsiales bacterium]|nr:hypothetical protein [Rickettsiales bacterium]
MSAIAMKQLANQLQHITAKNSGNGQLMQIILQVAPNKQPLLEKSVSEQEEFTIDDLSQYGEVVGWNFGRFVSEDTCQIVKERFDVEL